MSPTAKILIVDDEPKSLYTMEMLLSQEPYEICFATNGESVMRQVEAEVPDVLLLDVMMPDITGYEVCRRLRADARWKQLPIVLVTALDRKEDVVEGLDAGADEFLTKPVNGPELRARVRSMLRIKSQYDELQDMLQLREDMADMIVHDMRTPISSLMLYTDILTKTGFSQDYCSEIINKIRSQAQRLNAYLGDMLLMAKMRSGDLVLHKTSVNLASQLQLSLTQHQEMAVSKNIGINLELPDEKRTFSLDIKLIERVLDNLLSNALKYSPPNSQIQVILQYLENDDRPESLPKIRIQVNDHGPGIPKEQQETIFNKYEVVDIHPDEVPQVGLGLALCKKVVDSHNGRIYIKDNHPTGSRFIIEI